MVTLKELQYRIDHSVGFNSVCINCAYYSSMFCSIADTQINPLGTCDKQVSIQMDAVEPLQINGSIMTDSEYESLSNVTESDLIDIAERALEE